VTKVIKFTKRVWAEINLNNLAYNFNSLHKVMDDNQSMMAVVKANAYGHGDKIISSELQTLGVSWFAVSNIDEAISLRKAGITKKILILGYTPEILADTLVEYDLVQTVYCLDYAKGLSKNLSKPLDIHIKIDTGMSRIGFFGDTKSIISQVFELKKLENFNLSGIFTHLSSADSFDKDSVKYTNKQIEFFELLIDELKNNGITFENIHIENSAGIITTRKNISNIVRAGIMLYGLNPSENINGDIKPVMSLKAIVSMVKNVPENTSIGYSRAFVTSIPTKIATIPIGYADGYHRVASNQGSVLINGKKANIIGNVCMDQLMVDVSDIDVKIGDEVIIFGDGLSADEFAFTCKTINYEIVCDVSMRVPRVYIKNNEIIDIISYIN
jgi:alanine racemase